MTVKEFKVQLALGTLDKYKVADNPNTSKEILEYLSKDKGDMVRSFVACNPNTSKEVLEYLSKDENYLVSRYLKESNKE